MLKNRMLAIVLSLMLALSVAACGVAEVLDDDPETWPRGDLFGIWTPTEPWMEPYPETVTLTTVLAENSTITWPEGDSMANNIWTRIYKDAFNIELKALWVSSEYDTKLNLEIAANSLPDVFRVSMKQLKQLMDADMVLDITDVYEANVSDKLRLWMDECPDVVNVGKKDGRLYAIPELFYGYTTADQLWLRKDWMEELGLEPPTTIAELENIMIKMMENGAEYGLVEAKDLQALNKSAPMFGAYPSLWIEKDGKLEYGNIQPEMKNAIAQWTDWYQRGLINPNFATADDGSFGADILNGKVGVQFYPSYWGWVYGEDIMANQNVNAYFDAYEYPSATGEKVLYPIDFPGGSGFTVFSKDCKNPDAAIKLMNFYVNMGDLNAEHGIRYFTPDYTEYIKGVTNVNHGVGPFKIANPFQDGRAGERFMIAFETGETSQFLNTGELNNYLMGLEWIKNGPSIEPVPFINDEGELKEQQTAVGYWTQRLSSKSGLAVSSRIVMDDRLIRNKLWGELPEALAQYGSTLSDILLEGYTQIIMGDQPIDYFDTLVETWYAAGGADVTAAVNEMYGAK